MKKVVNRILSGASIIMEHGKGNGSGNVEELVRRAQNGDWEAFDQIVMKYQADIFRLAYRMLDNRDDALDVVQETFYKFWRSLKSFRGDSSVRLYLETIATRLCISHYRKRRLFASIEDIFGLGSHPAWDEQIDSDRIKRALAEAMNELSPRERAAFVLRMEREYSTEQTAQILGISPGTVKSLLHRANEKMKKKLRKLLPEQFGEGENEKL